MTTQVLYRKWRPRTFAELAGQDHVSAVLRQAVVQGRISHAYLFCGPRGTGKTTTARVLARAVNCLSPQEGEPDNQCSICQNMDRGRAMDLIEMDAASNRGIDEIRSIREKVHFAPAEGRYKVYIVDEAHMLTEAASNAFLKTLEEPPSHVIFILCTTEPHKILPTIISRCQRFDFRRIPNDTTVIRLRSLCAQEGIEADSGALRALARASGGSLRDAENLLEQAVVSYGNKVEAATVEEMLGLGLSQEAKDLVTYMLLGKTPSALATIAHAAQGGADPRRLHHQALELLRAVLMIQSGAADTVELDSETLKDIETLAGKASTGKVMACLKAVGEVRLGSDASDTLALELAVVEVSLAGTAETPPAQRTPAPAPMSSNRPPRPTTPQRPPSRPVDRQPSPPRTPAANPPSQNPIPAVPSHDEAFVPTPVVTNGSQVAVEAWSQVIQVLRRHKGKRFFIGALLKDCKTPHLEGDAMVLPFSHRSNMERMEEELEEVENRNAIEKALRQFLGESYQIRLTLHGGDTGNSRPAAATSPMVRAARQMGGRIVEERKIDE